jgi:hypothetical protein
MPTDDLTPEQWEDLVATDHCCDERCYTRHHTDHLEPVLEDHPLLTGFALSECGPAGRAGSVHPELLMHTLWGLATDAVGLKGAEDWTTADLAKVGAKYTELLEEWEFDMATRDVLRRAEESTARAVRQEQRRQEFARRRAMPRTDRRSPNKPARVDVNPEAWAVVKEHALQRGRKVAEVVGDLLVEPPGPFHSHSGARPERRFARVFIGHLDWVVLRVIAAQERVTVTRLIGVIVEHEAKRLGWTPAVDR